MSNIEDYAFQSGQVDAFEKTLVQSSDSVLTGLTSGAMVVTRNGEIPVEWLETSDEVLTRDRGFEKVLWINRVKLERESFRDRPDYAPVTIPAGRIDSQFPMYDVTASPDQLVMVNSPMAERDYWSTEVLVPARALGTQAVVDDMRWSSRAIYTQIMLSTHEAIIVDGLWCGTVFTGSMAKTTDMDRSPLAQQMKDPRTMSTRPILNIDEARVLMSEIDEFNAKSNAKQNMPMSEDTIRESA
ncbi:MAG: Hint domain-containing protein [Paracoccaceae bacterium]